MAQTDLFIEDLVSIYKQKQQSDTFLRGSLEIPGCINNLSTPEIDQMIMPRLVTIFPEIVEHWALDVVTDLTTIDLRSYLCLIRDDDPDQLVAIEALSRYQD